MLSQDQIEQVPGSDAYGPDGGKIGRVGQIYLDDQSGQPAWATVNTGLFGTNENFVPLTEASFTGDQLTVPYDKNKVKEAPSVSEDGHTTSEEEQALYQYYGVGYSTGYDTTTTTQSTGYDTSGPTTDNAMTRSEEKLRVGKAAEEARSGAATQVRRERKRLRDSSGHAGTRRHRA